MTLCVEGSFAVEPRLEVVVVVDGHRQVTEVVCEGEVAPGRVHIRHQVLLSLLNLQLVVRHDQVSVKQLREVVFAETHVLDGESFAKLKDKLSIPIDEEAVPRVLLLMLRQHLSFDVYLDRRAIDCELKGDQDGLVLKL